MAGSEYTSCGLTFHDVDINTSDKSILAALMNKYYHVSQWRIKRGIIYSKNGNEYQRIYVKIDSQKTVDEYMKSRPFQLNGKPLIVMRTLPNTYHLYDRIVTGLKIKIQSLNNDHLLTRQINENDLRKHFQKYGTILRCQWTNKDKTEAQFQFKDYDEVDKTEDFIIYDIPYCIHVTNLPVRVTSAELSDIFKVSVPSILVYPCFQIEQSHLTAGRTSSEAWIKGFDDESTAHISAKRNSGRIVRTNTIQCEVMPEQIEEQELCTNFQKGQCSHTSTTCHFKHISCDELDTCEDQNCWYGHTNKRTTISFPRTQQRLEDARYRLKLSNLPSDITDEDLMKRLNLDSKYSQLLILQPTDDNCPNLPKSAYLIRQQAENRLRQLISKCHNKPFSPTNQQRIQCQLEVSQQLFEWHDFTNVNRTINSSRCTSPTPSIQSAYSNRSRPAKLYSSAASAIVSTQNISENSHATRRSHVSRQISTNQSTVPKTKATTSLLKTRTVTKIRPPPSDMFNSTSQWTWTDQMLSNDSFDHDESYWLETSSKKDMNNVIAKVYLPKNDRTTLLRAQRERIALQNLSNLKSVPKVFESNVNITSNIIDEDSSKKEFWTIMKLIDGERLSDYIKNPVRIDLKGALEIIRPLLTIVKKIHGLNVIHRDIQPKNILVERHPTMNDIKLMLINFASAWINGNQLTNSMESIDARWTNQFYLVPQLEERFCRNNKRIQPCQYSPTIDASSICATFFWLITGHKPRESRDICEKAPHQIHDNVKCIKQKIADITGFNIDGSIGQHLEKHLMLIFDRGFTNPGHQWSIDELDYQFQWITTLLMERHEQVNYFPVSLNINTQTLSSSIPFGDLFIYIVSLINQLKTQLVTRYCTCMRWSTEGKSRWITEDKRIENHDVLVFWYQESNLTIDIQWHIQILQENQFKLHIKANGSNQVAIELPLGIWTMKQQANDFDTLLNSFEIEMKILITILLESLPIID
ncbi:hypothetical protein I4U23_003486 [Adineta vaga]|nr:hypothetical protein I4U23_003486 [Adineta vaga]